MTDTTSQPQQHHLLHPHEVYSNPSATGASGGYQQQQDIQQQQQHGDPRQQQQHHLYQQAPLSQGQQGYPMVRIQSIRR